MFRLKQRFLLILLSCILGFLLTGCALRALFGNVIIVEDIGEEVNEIITTVFSDSTAAVCLNTDYGFFECTYIIDGEIITSTLYLLSEYGLTGVLIDPVIIQVPADVMTVTATYNNASGANQLSIWVTESYQATPDITINAESGRKFIILELPPLVTDQLPEGDPSNGLQLDFTLSFTRVQPIVEPVAPMNIKIMLAGRVLINQHRYYVPILPCVTDFSSIPEVEIPISNTPVDLQPAIGTLLQAANAVCDHHAYNFNNVPPPPEMIFLPMISS